mmetsp:Transcript_19966/g.40135  ORF Transcript_19966/g.40135 Transcript_19966/m.40135 type:complete len:205 (-) Transcript_19966:2294-2908(-)
MNPRAGFSGFALNSRTSASKRIFSSNSSIPSFVTADTLAHCTSPPKSSVNTSYDASSPSSLGMSVVGLSILFTATITGTSAALIILMLSTVCSITPSSAATTRTTTSVTLAPLPRISLNAACPGVSMKVILVDFPPDASALASSPAFFPFFFFLSFFFLSFPPPFAFVSSAVSTMYAPIDCVIPPTSPDATLAFLIASSKEVLP